MNGPPLVLGRVVVVAAFLLGAAGSTHARAGTETPSFREQAECHKHREAGEHVQAAERCLAAYNALPDVPEALEARAVMAFDGRHSFRDAYDMTGDVKHLCGEIRLMIRFLNYLERHVPADERPYDRQDAQKYLDAGREELGARSCTEQPPEEPKSEPEPEPEPVVTPTPAPAIDVAAAPPAIRPTLKISGWTLFGLGLGLGMWATAEMVLAEVDQRARATLIASNPGAGPGRARRPARRARRRRPRRQPAGPSSQPASRAPRSSPASRCSRSMPTGAESSVASRSPPSPDRSFGFRLRLEF
jgi:hypothetical protein